MPAQFRICFLLFLRQFDGLFVEVGNYPDYRTGAEVNLDRCGRRNVPKTTIQYNKGCFHNQYENQSFSEDYIEIIKHRIPRREKTLNRIFQGRDALDFEAPWTVRMVVHTKIFKNEKGTPVNGVLCSGVLVTFEWVMTAAHCFPYGLEIYGAFVTAGPDKIKLVVQKNKIFKMDIWVLLSSLAVNESFPKEYRNVAKMTAKWYDIVLVKLQQKYSPNLHSDQYYYVNPICLPKADLTSNADLKWDTEITLNVNEENATFAGWGTVDEKDTFPDNLQIADIRLIDPKKCVPKNMLCANLTEFQSRACKGDSGGPLYQYTNEINPRAILIGIAQGADDNTCSAIPNQQFWASPLRYMPWILKIIAGN